MKAPVDMDQAHHGTPSTGLEADKLLLLHLIEQYRQTPDDTLLPPHPMFGKLSREQWGRFIYVHLDHHLRQFDK